MRSPTWRAGEPCPGHPTTLTTAIISLQRPQVTCTDFCFSVVSKLSEEDLAVLTAQAQVTVRSYLLRANRRGRVDCLLLSLPTLPSLPCPDDPHPSSKAVGPHMCLAERMKTFGQTGGRQNVSQAETPGTVPVLLSRSGSWGGFNSTGHWAFLPGITLYSAHANMTSVGLELHTKGKQRRGCAGARENLWSVGCRCAHTDPRGIA